LVVLILVISFVAQPALAGPVSLGYEFVKQAGPELRLNGKFFNFAGTNNYYLMYKSPFMVDDVLTTAAANGFKVIRIWGSLEIGNLDGSNSVDGKKEGIYFQYWDGAKPAYNDGPDGLERLDYIVNRAGQLGLKRSSAVNNWNALAD
jgi:mannan endo-1,4-beta-mannosidase